MEPNGRENPAASLMDRFRKSWSGPAAVAGAFAAFSAAFFRVRPEPPAAASAGQPTVLLPVVQPPAVPAPDLPRTYSPAGILGAPGSTRPFRRSLAGVAAGSADCVYALGDSEVRLFDATGAFVRAWQAPEWATCIAAARGGRVLVAGGATVEIMEPSGRRAGGFAISGAARAAAITAVKAFDDQILVADAAARLIFRFDSNGRRLGEIGNQTRAGRFMLPNRLLDFDVNSEGLVVAGDSGRHRVTLWDMEGAPRGSFGKFGMTDPGDFVGCCNPVDIAWTSDGNIVTAEKMVARVKVYEPGGKLLAVIGPEYFDPRCTSIRLAVDSRGRILAADPVRREIRVFAQQIKDGTR